MTGTVVPVRRTRRKAPAQIANVVPLHAPKETTEDIVRAVQERTRRQEEEVLTCLRDLTATLRERHRETAQELLPIGYAMSATALRDFIEIGRRMLGQGGRFR